MLKKHWKLISLIGVACLAVCIGAATTIQAVDDESEVSIRQVPASVKATLLAQANGGTIEEIVIETEEDKTVYEADVVIDGQEVEIQVASDGTLLGTETEDDDEDEEDDEEEVSLDAVPEAVKATILKEAAGAQIEEVVKETEEGQIVYDAEFVVDGQEVAIEVASDGTLLEREIEDDDD